MILARRRSALMASANGSSGQVVAPGTSAPLDVPESVPAGDLQGGAEQGAGAYVVAVEKEAASLECGFGGAER
ncbi:MAG TPA: hypothetical protein VFC16_15440 [Nakamurella sp.]|nr:hypothetical protein [Nakamurella sp.]